MVKKYTGWKCLDCNSTSYHKCKDDLCCGTCGSTNLKYFKKGKRLSKKEEMDACMVRMGLKTANPFGYSFDAMANLT